MNDQFYIVNADFKACDPFSSVSPGLNYLVRKGTLVKKLNGTNNLLIVLTGTIHHKFLMSTSEDLGKYLDIIDSKYIDLLYK